jgi:hypothetical protein
MIVCPTVSIVFCAKTSFSPIFFEAAGAFFRAADETSPGGTTDVVRARNS